MMRVILGIAVGITATIISYIVWQPAIKRDDIRRAVRWVFTRVPVLTHPDCTPRYRTWRNHIETSREPWQ